MAEALSPEEQIMALRRELAERDAIIAAREAELAEATIVKAKLTAALLEIEQIKMQLATLRRQRYGRSSEKLDNDIPQLEMRLEDCEEDVGEHLAARPERDRHSAHRPRGKSGRKPLPSHLPREVVVHEPEIVCSCGNCDPARLARLGEIITEVLEKIPARLKVIRHVRPKYACRLCETIFQAPAPELPIEKGRPGAGLLAHIAISKYCDGLPLYRQSGILAREGVEIDRTTMAEWMGHVAWWLRPLAALISDYVMAQPVIWTDDTPIRTLAPGTGKTRLSRFWCYAIDPRPYQGPGYPAVLYRYTPIGRANAPAAISTGSTATCTRMPLLATRRCIAPMAETHRELPTWLAWRTLDASCSRCLKTQSRRSPKRHCGGSRNSMPSKPTSRAEPLTNVGWRGRRAASHCSMPSMSGRSPSDDGCPVRHHWAKHCSMG